MLFYVCIFFLSTLVVDYKKIKLNSQINSLNAIKPSSFRYLIELVNAPERSDQNKILPFAYFYQKMIDYSFDLDEAYGMLGFCYHQLGMDEHAIKMYKKAIQLNPKFFWFYHNLGVIYFQNGRYGEAVDVLRRGVKTDAHDTLSAIQSSKVIYRSILIEEASFANNTVRRLGEGYKNAYRMLVLSQYHQKNFFAMLDAANAALAAKFPEEEFFYYYAGVAAYQLKDYAKAADLLQRCIQEDPKLSDAYYFLGLSLKALGKEDEGEKFLGQGTVLKGSGNSMQSSEKEFRLQMI